MMDPKQKSLLIKIGIGVAALLGVAYLCSDDGEKEANEAARRYSRMVNAEMNEARTIAEKQVDARYEYKADELLNRLKRHLRNMESAAGESRELAEEMEAKNDIQQPQHVIDVCKNHRERIQKLNKEWKKIQGQAEADYRSTRTEWEAEAAKPDSESDELNKAKEICAKFPEYLEEAEKRRKGCENGWEARGIYNRLIKRLKLKGPQIRSQLDKRIQESEQAKCSREQVTGAGNVVDDTKDKMKEINEVMAKIRACSGGSEEVALPALKPEPKPLPPPEFKPDLVLTATGDMPDTLLRPLVERWLADNQATPVKGTRFIWEVRKGNKELEVNAPAAIQGAEAGKLRVRIVPVQNTMAAFEAVGTHGNVHLMLTGAAPNREMLACWLPEGTDSAHIGREFKARVCYDALVFFKGSGLEMKMPLRSAIMKKQAAVYSVNDAARMEAAQVYGFAPQAQDVEEPRNLSAEELCAAHADKMIFGVWHKDAAGAMSYSKMPTICYAAGWESEEAFKNVPQEYLPRTEGVEPTPANIAAGRYAYSYSIYAYRSLRDTGSRASALAAQLLAYMADAENARVAQTIKDAGFVPVELSVEHLTRTNELTRDDLPLPVLLKAMGADAEKFGYDADDAEWVYGIRVPFAMYFETGSAKGGEGQVTLDADATYYTSTQAFARIQELVKDGRAAIVVLGHADIQHAGALKVDVASWRSNLSLSQKRASYVGKDFKKKFPANEQLRHVAIGTGWARPACDISLAKPAKEQQNELARCRRAEVFIIFPVPGSGK